MKTPLSFLPRPLISDKKSKLIAFSSKGNETANKRQNKCRAASFKSLYSISTTTFRKVRVIVRLHTVLYRIMRFLVLREKNIRTPFKNTIFYGIRTFRPFIPSYVAVQWTKGREFQIS